MFLTSALLDWGLVEVRHLLTDADLFLGAAIGHMPMVRVEVPNRSGVRHLHSLLTPCCVILGQPQASAAHQGVFVVRGGGTTFLPNRCLHLAQTTVAGLSFDGELSYGQPQASSHSAYG